MANRRWITLAVLLAGWATVVSAQDARRVIQNAEKTMGDVQSIQYSGTGKMGGLGQDWAPNTPWHGTIVTSYTRTIDYASRSSKVELTRTEENPPDRGGEIPFDGTQKQVNLVSGEYAWNQPGSAPMPRNNLADERQLQIWLTPQGFLKAAAEHGATLSGGKNSHVITFMIGKHKVTGEINAQNLMTKVDTWIANPVLGDMPVDTTYSNYKDFGGVKFPTHIVQKQGGFATLDLTVTDVKHNVQGASLQVPESVRQASPPPVRVTSQKLADGVWFFGGGSHNSVLVEFKNYVAVIEAPLNDARSEAVMAEVKKLVPDKPIRYVINTHHHFDHSGGLRTYVTDGVTVITNQGNKGFYERAWSKPRTLAPDVLSRNPRKAVFVTYRDKYVLSDGSRTLEIHRILNDRHNKFMSFAYMPKERILIEADDFTPPRPNGPGLVPISLGFANNLYANLVRLKIEPKTIAPLHGYVVPFSAMQKALGKPVS